MADSTKFSDLPSVVSEVLAPRSRLVYRFIGLSVFGSRNQAKDHRLRTVQRTAYPT